MPNETPNPAVPGSPGPVPPGPAVVPGVPGDPAKRGRGRPSNASRLGLPPLAGKPGAPAPAGGSPGNIPAPLWTPENCGPFGQLPFMVAGVATGYQGWELTDPEVKMLSGPLSQVLNLLVPAGGKYAAVAALGSTALVIVGMKSRGYLAWKAVEDEKRRRAGPPEKKEIPAV